MNRRGRAWSRAIALGAVLAACSPGGKRAAAERSEPASAAVTLTRDRLDGVRDAFNAGSEGPRLIVFFSSGCASCDTGSAALQAMLDRVERPMTVIAVWEPIEPTDPPPRAEFLDNLTDARVRQVWDPEHIMSRELRAAELAHPGSIPQARLRTNKDPDGILYDTAVLFRPGARWTATLPAPDYLDGGLAAVVDELRRRLEGATATTPADKTSALVDLDRSLDAIRAEFNAHRNEARFVTLLAPT